ncbi:MAG: hypothetical protein EOO65_03220, partial [Methanosarcinales archaeon]
MRLAGDLEMGSRADEVLLVEMTGNHANAPLALSTAHYLLRRRRDVVLLPMALAESRVPHLGAAMSGNRSDRVDTGSSGALGWSGIFSVHPTSGTLLQCKQGFTGVASTGASGTSVSCAACGKYVAVTHVQSVVVVLHANSCYHEACFVL